MSGETEKAVSGWTVDTLHSHIIGRQEDLKELLDERFTAQKTAMDAALKAAEKITAAAMVSAKEAVTKAELATEKRMEGLNELRGVVTDISALQMPRAECEQRIAALDAAIDDLKERLNKTASLAVVETLTTRMTTIESHKAGGRDQINAIYALAAFFVTVIIIGTVLAANGIFGN